MQVRPCLSLPFFPPPYPDDMADDDEWGAIPSSLPSTTTSGIVSFLPPQRLTTSWSRGSWNRSQNRICREVSKIWEPSLLDQLLLMCLLVHQTAANLHQNKGQCFCSHHGIQQRCDVKFMLSWTISPSCDVILDNFMYCCVAMKRCHVIWTISCNAVLPDRSAMLCYAMLFPWNNYMYYCVARQKCYVFFNNFMCLCYVYYRHCVAKLLQALWPASCSQHHHTYIARIRLLGTRSHIHYTNKIVHDNLLG